MRHPNETNTLASTYHRSERRCFGIRQDDRLHHLYVIGKTGTGKTTLLQTLAETDIRMGRGLAVLDPHGDFAERLTAYAKWCGRSDLTSLDLADPDCLFAYNPLARISSHRRPLVVSGLIDVFRLMWADAWGPRMEHVLRNALFALLDQPNASFPDILRLMSEKTFRLQAIRNIKNEQVRRFWRSEFPKYSWRNQADAIAPIQNKVGALLADPRLYRFLTASEGQLRLRSIMDEGQVLIVNLSKGRLGSDSAGLIGGVLVTALGLAAFSRAELPEHERRPFFIYIDEFQSFTTLALAEMLSELRKFGVGLVMAHQYLHQLRPDIRHAVLGNVGTTIAFRVGPEDASFLAREFEERFGALDLMRLPNHHIYLKLMIDGSPSKPFSATTLPPGESGPSTVGSSHKEGLA